MKKLMKWLLWSIVLMVVLAIALVVALPRLLNQEEVKTRLSQYVETHTGHALHLNGPLDLRLFPWIGLRLQDVVLDNAAGFDDKPLAKMDYLDLKLGLKPLFSRRISVDTVVMQGLQLNLARNAKGKGNWEGLIQQRQTAPNSNSPRLSDGDFQIRLKGIEVENMSIDWRDERAKQAFSLNGLSLRVGELAPGRQVPVGLRLALHNTKPALDLQMNLVAELTYSQDMQKLDLPGTSIEVQAKGENLPEKGIDFKIAADVRLDLRQDALTFSDLSLALPGVAITGDVSLQALRKQMQLEARLHLQQTNLRTLLSDWGIDLNTRDEHALSQCSGELFARYSQKSGLRIEPFKFILDQSHIQGFIALPSFTGPVVRTQLDIDTLDLDRYLVSEAEQTTQPTAPMAKQLDTPLASLKRLDFSGRFQIGALRLNGLNMQKITIALKAKQGIVELKALNAALYQGQLQASASLNLNKQPPRFWVKKDLRNVRLGPLLKDLQGIDNLTGKANVHTKLQGRGLDWETIKRHLNGRTDFVVEDGSYKGINLMQEIRRARALFKGQQLDEPRGPAKTDFTQIKAHIQIHDGILKNDDFLLRSPLFQIEGQGRVDLPRSKVDYRLTAKVVGKVDDLGKPIEADLLGLAIPVRIHGALSQPQWRLDLKSALAANAKSRLKEKALEKIDEKLGKGVLQSLFK